MSIGRDIYLDSRHMIETLEKRYPPSDKYPGIQATTPKGKALELLLRSWTTDGGVFMNAAALIPNEYVIFNSFFNVHLPYGCTSFAYPKLLEGNVNDIDKQ